MERFAAKCRFDPGTGCVIWIGGTTSGHGHHHPYGSFWFEGRRWFAHRWAARYIHGQNIDDMQVDHCCPDGVPHTLCVQHLQAVPPRINRELQWIRAQVGLDPAPPDPLDPFEEVPFFDPPEWLAALQPQRKDTWLTSDTTASKPTNCGC